MVDEPVFLPANLISCAKAKLLEGSHSRNQRDGSARNGGHAVILDKTERRYVLKG